MASGSGTSTASGTSPDSPVLYTKSTWEVLVNWVDNDETKSLLIEREHAPGREDHAIRFAEYMIGWNFRPTNHKNKFKTKPEFYAYLQSTVTPGVSYDTRKPEDKTGFSESSCKRLTWEGACYIRLKKKGTNNFPQSQSAAVALNNNTTDDNILEVWKYALGMYAGNKKRVGKSDILTAVERCKMRTIQASEETITELENTKQLLDIALEKQREFEEKAKELEKKVQDVENHQNHDVDELNLKKRKLLDEFCLAYEDDTRKIPIYCKERLEEILDDTDSEVYLDSLPDENGNNIITCKSMDEWKNGFYEYGLLFSKKKCSLIKGKSPVRQTRSPPDSG